MTDDHKRLAHAAALRSNLEPLATLHAIVPERIERLKERADALEAAVTRVEQEKSEEGDALSSLQAASEDAVRRARLVGVKLEAAFLEGQVPEETYRAALAAAFPQGGQSIGGTPQARLEALRGIVAAMHEHEAADPEGALGRLAEEGARAIEEANADAKREQAEAREANEALSEARAAFDRGYRATREIVTGLLREANRLDEIPDIFPDR
jgi:hypothetical protein